MLSKYAGELSSIGVRRINISLDTLKRDLSEWDTLYLAGRLHKPVKILRDETAVRPIRVAGKRNLVLLLAVVASVAFLHAPYRELAMLALSALSLALTPRAVREANRFTFHAIAEVAALFAGIFLTMLPALGVLHAHGRELGLTETTIRKRVARL